MIAHRDDLTCRSIGRHAAGETGVLQIICDIECGIDFRNGRLASILDSHFKQFTDFRYRHRTHDLYVGSCLLYVSFA